LNFAKELGWADYKEMRDAATVVQMIPFSSEQKTMGAVGITSTSRVLAKF
jgi:Ca2+-transporting ATPase